MNLLNFVNSKKIKFKKGKIQNKKLIIATIGVTTLLAGVGSTILMYSLTTSNDTSIKQIEQDNSVDTSLLVTNGNTFTDQTGVQIRTNYVNGFESIDVLSHDGSITGNKLVLTTYTNGTQLNYGVGLVDSDYNIISTWAMPIVGETYKWNYTTNIIPGSDNETFFVLAGISNIAHALNTVYTNYNSSATNFEDVVTVDLTSAPSIKIFKINVTNNIIRSDSVNPVYDFKYPTYDDQPTYNNGLKFFTKTGNFASNLIQQSGYANNSSYASFGYLQYLFYGQLFQYNYNSSDNTDEFALLSSYLGSDPGMGNLYGYYNSTINKQSSALGYYEYFYNEVLTPMIEGNPKSYTTTPYVLNSSAPTRTNYKVIDQAGNIIEAPISDQLTSDAALSIAFMTDYRAANIPSSSDNTASLTGAMTRVGHNEYNIVPGWFIFKPNISPDWVSYGYTFTNINYTTANGIWGTAVGSFYDVNNNEYLTLFAASIWVTNNRFVHFKIQNFDYFSLQYTKYGSRNIISPNNSNNILPFDVSTTSQIWNKSMFMKVLDPINRIISFSINTDKIGIFINEIGSWILSDKNLFNLSQPLINFQYNIKLKLFGVITNTNIYSYIINNNSLSNYTDNDVNSRQLDTPLISVSHVSGEIILADNFVYNPDDKGELNGVIIGINGLVTTVSQVYSIQTITDTTTNNASVIGVLSPNQVGYQVVRNDSDFSANERNLSISQLYTEYTSQQLSSLFAVGARTNGTQFVSQKGFIAPKADFSSISIQEVIVYNGNTMFGFAIKASDLAESVQNNTYDKWEAKYTDVFVNLVLSVVWYLEVSNVINNEILRATSVLDMVNMYNNDFNGFQNKFFNLIVTRIDNRNDSLQYYLRISDYNLNTNSITFHTTAVTQQGEVILAVANPSQSGSTNFNYTNVFASSIVDNTILYLIIGLSVAVGLIIILGLAIGIPMHKNRKAIQMEFKLSNKKIDVLTSAVGNVFKSLTKKIDDNKHPNLLKNKQPTPIKRTTTSTVKPPINPVKTNLNQQMKPNPIPKKPNFNVKPNVSKTAETASKSTTNIHSDTIKIKPKFTPIKPGAPKPFMGPKKN
ncbi:hypothetical protein [Mycoplasmoides alvi]|uniref:hypothetical protein n=1 Tax=Mycoplasmoides alvi TaxID=78580 RepID=UPI00051C524E|nr:hypothetical protein [Mycoplasmoides alvi]